MSIIEDQKKWNNLKLLREVMIADKDNPKLKAAYLKEKAMFNNLIKDHII